MRNGNPNGLICTHHLYQWAGSETVVFELVKELRKRGVDLSIYCPFVDFAFVRSVLGNEIPIIFDPDHVDLAAYDFVFSNHQTPSRFLAQQSDDVLFGSSRPVFIYNHMSPHEPFELPGVFCEGHFADIILCNSPETGRRLSELGQEYANPVLYRNPAPKQFERPAAPPNPKRLKRLLCVSNHVPAELEQAFEYLAAQGVDVTHAGLPDNNRQVLPEDLWNHDAVVTIGKTVQYALRARTPVFCYDVFQGPGWLDAENFDAAADVNFSGRCHQVWRDPETLAKELAEGFASAAAFAGSISPDRIAPFRLEDQVSNLLQKIEARLSEERPEAVDWCQEDRRYIRQQIQREKSTGDLIDREYRNALQAGPGVTAIRKVHRLSGPHPIEAKVLRQPPQGKAMVVAAFSFRYDAHLVPGLLENLAPSIHAWIAWDDRKADATLTDDAGRQRALYEAARKLGADWILATDPDERFESNLATRIEDLTNNHGPVCWNFSCREMFTPNQYRVDGLWQVKPRLRLFPCLPGMEPDGTELHGAWTRNGIGAPVRDTGMNFYHLRMASADRRKHRRDLYAAADPDRRFQAIGYDYLCDERGMVLKEVPSDQTYSPQFVEDGGLWAPELDTIGAPRADAEHVGLRWASVALEKHGTSGAFYRVKDVADASRQDLDVKLLAAALALETGKPDTAIPLCDDVAGNCAERDDVQACTAILRSRAQMRLREQQAAHSAVSWGRDFASLERPLREQVISTLPVSERFRHPDALWRRWAKDVKLYEGANISTSDLAVVLLSVGAPAELLPAVKSLRAQDEPCEIVVVNSGGGDVRSLLSTQLDHIRLIDVPERVLPGCARNIGIDASAAENVGFLASDCIARPGWVRRRRMQHLGGLDVVASSVVPNDPDNLFTNVSSAYQHWTRWPDTPAQDRASYGRSYARWLFESYGYFPTGLRVGEDTYFNGLLPSEVRSGWAPDVQTAHRYPKSFVGLGVDMFRRGYRRADHAPFQSFSNLTELRRFLSVWIRKKNRDTHKAVLHSGDHNPNRLKLLVLTLRITSRAEGFGILWRARKSHRADSLRKKAVDVAARSPKRAAQLQRAASRLQGENVNGQMVHADWLVTQGAGEKNEIMVALRKAWAADPQNPAPILKLLACLQNDGQQAAALETVRQACALAPRQVELWWARHGLTKTMDLPVETLFCLLRLLALRPGDANVHAALAVLHDLNGDRALHARRSLHERALRRVP